MNKTRIILIVVLVLLIIAGIALGIFTFLLPKKSGLTVETNPASTVFVNGEEAGRTPYKNTLNEGEITLKLIPDSFGSPLLPYETKVDLVAGVDTVVRRIFDSTEEYSQGETISFNKTYKGESEILVVSNPEGGQVVIDRQVKGFTPYTSTNITPGEHSVTVEAKGYLSRTISVRSEPGYKLIISVKLAKDQSAENQESETKDPDEEKIDMVEILDTPTGFLRVREEDSLSTSEVGQVIPGNKYQLVEENNDNTWFRIKFDQDKVGWVSSQYAKKIDATASGELLN